MEPTIKKYKKWLGDAITKYNRSEGVASTVLQDAQKKLNELFPEVQQLPIGDKPLSDNYCQKCRKLYWNCSCKELPIQDIDALAEKEYPDCKKSEFPIVNIMKTQATEAKREVWKSGYKQCLEDRGSDAKAAFEAAREFDSQDGVVDVHIVLNIPDADNSDLQPVYPTFEDWQNSKNK